MLSRWFEEVRPCRQGQPVRVLRTDAPAGSTPDLTGLTDAQLQFWYRNLAARGTLYHETRLLRAECERRGFSTEPDEQSGQLDLFAAMKEG